MNKEVHAETITASLPNWFTPKFSRKKVERDGDTSVIFKERTSVKKPRRYNVIMHNDHFTTMEFVVMVLVDIFHKNPSQAHRIMLDVHRKGAGHCGKFTKDIAETKINQVHEQAQSAGYPLRCSAEPEPE